MKKTLFTLATVLALASCAKVSTVAPVQEGTDGPIGFIMTQGNMVKANSALQKAGHYNFGVFAYKSTDKVNNVMADYLVGYSDETNKIGYKFNGQSTVGDAAGNLDGQSMWQYEGLGSAQYTYGGSEGYYRAEQKKYMSNVESQYLRYWDKASDYTCFYAYAPYTNYGETGKKVTYVDGQKVGTSSDEYVMTIPNGTIKHGYDKADEFEYMYAWTKVAKADYGHDVALNFNRLNAKVNIKFWEDIPGYNVRIVDLTSNYSVSAVPAIKDGTSNDYGYKLGKIYSENGAKIQFDPENATPANPNLKQYEGTTVSTPIKFDAPTAAQIGTTRVEATPSTTTYYAIPKGSSADVLEDGADTFADTKTVDADLALTGLTFHVSYELISTTGEIIKVKNATVFVPETYTNWVANTHYTYIFKITTSSNGSTDSTDPTDPDVEDPEVPTEPALYPIVFDNCTVEDWTEIESEHNITDGTKLGYHNVVLSQYSITDGSATNITVTIEDNDKDLNHPVDYSKITVTKGSDNFSSWYTSGSKTIAVPANAAAGVYTVTYTCAAADVYANHPQTWTAKFYVGNAYTVSTNLNEVGTHGLAASALSISATKDAGSFVPTAAQLSIEYPVNLSDTEKARVKVSSDGTKVEVAQTAAVGKYKLLLTIDEGGNGVKVAEKIFEVKDYQFELNNELVVLDGDQTVTANKTADTDHVYTVTGGLTVTGNSIAVPASTPEGDYTVTYTLYGESTDPNHVSTVQYHRTFTVANIYTVTLSKNTLDTTVGAEGAAEYGTDYIDITSTKNGVADELSAATAAKYTVEGLDAANYKIEFVPAVADPATPAHIKLQVKKSVPAGNYTVVYTGQPDKKVEAEFVIQN